MRTVGPVGLHLHVDVELDVLARRLGDRLASIEDREDPFRPDLVVVPGAALRTWLTQRLADHLGIVAHLEVAYPATLIARVLGGEASGLGRWRPGPLTWAVVAAMAAEPDRFGEPDPVRARTIADLFDRYTLHRPAMVRAWSAGRDVDGVGAALAEHHRWQPALWRLIEELDGRRSDAVVTHEIVTRLRGGDAETVASLDDLPPQISVFGISSVPALHLEVFGALAGHREVSFYVATPSVERWRRRRASMRAPVVLPLDRRDSPLGTPGGHPLLDRWGRSGEEGLFLLTDLVTAHGGTVHDHAVDMPGDVSTLLGRLRGDLRADRRPEPDPALAASDASLRWHRTFGPARQVEALRDHLLHLFAETDDRGRVRFEPRDVTIMCTDIATFAPLVDAVFAGDPEHGVPAIPVAVADRTLTEDNAVAAALDALFDLTDGRFRLDALGEFANRSVVRRRFGLGAEDVTRVVELLAGVNVRWGLDPADQARLGIEPLGAHTVLDGLERLMCSAVGADALDPVVFDTVVTHTEVTLADLGPLGRFAALVDRLRHHIDALGRPTDPCSWIARVQAAVADLVDAEDPLASRRVQRVLAEMDDDARRDGEARKIPVAPEALVALTRRRLGGGPGRARFGTGRVTVSALTAQRGIPSRVIGVLGLDVSAEASVAVTPDDLISATPCVGDRDARSEQRAQFLDAVMAAQERLVVCSTGFDLRTRGELPPGVVLAELGDLVKATTGSGLARLDHPRQGWSEIVFDPNAFDLGHPWSFDRGARAAALARRHPTAPVSAATMTPLERPVSLGTETVSPADLERVLRDPCAVFARDRLGLILPAERDDGPDVDIALERLAALHRWGLESEVLDTVVANADRAQALEDWLHRARSAGDLPPRGFAAPVVAEMLQRAELLDRALEGLGLDRMQIAPRPVEIAATHRDGSPVEIVGSIPGVVGDRLLYVTASKPQAHQDLVVWCRLVLCQIIDPTRSFEAVLIRRNTGAGLDVSRRRLRRPDRAHEALCTLLDVFDEARRRPVPFFPGTSRRLAEILAHDRDPSSSARRPSARSEWEGKGDSGRGDRRRPSVQWFFDLELDELRRRTDADDWADRIFGEMDADVEVTKVNAGRAGSTRRKGA